MLNFLILILCWALSIVWRRPITKFRKLDPFQLVGEGVRGEDSTHFGLDLVRRSRPALSNGPTLVASFSPLRPDDGHIQFQKRCIYKYIVYNIILI
jgi:hypothetical protein